MLYWKKVEFRPIDPSPGSGEESPGSGEEGEGGGVGEGKSTIFPSC